MDGCKNFKRQFFDPYIEYDKLKKEKSHSTVLRWLYNKLTEEHIEAKTKGYFKANTTSVNLETGQGSPYWPYTFSVNKAIVQVDDETGKVDVLELIACHDSGKIINPSMAQGQIEGGCAMGLGYALMEEIEFKDGCIKNSNFADYIIPTSIDVPKINTCFIEEDEVTGPYGAKGLGEPSMISTAPAILNAIYDAVGVRILDLPATCDKVLLAIKNKEKNNG
jgi:CO/xanthine dehydrogenase Mo-binding subunit